MMEGEIFAVVLKTPNGLGFSHSHRQGQTQGWCQGNLSLHPP